MTMFLFVSMIVLSILFYLYPEHRKKIRIPIVIIMAILLVSFAWPSFRCAINISPGSLMTFDWEVISFQHERCMFANELNELIG